MPHIDPVRLIFGLILIATILGLMTWISGRSFFTLLDQEDKSPGTWFYIVFTGALALAALGFLIAGTILWIPFFF
jgi:hypothetical protein